MIFGWLAIVAGAIISFFGTNLLATILLWVGIGWLMFGWLGSFEKRSWSNKAWKEEKARRKSEVERLKGNAGGSAASTPEAEARAAEETRLVDSVKRHVDERSSPDAGRQSEAKQEATDSASQERKSPPTNMTKPGAAKPPRPPRAPQK
jgi:hypothetical protein